MPLGKLSKYKSVFIYGASMAALLFMLKWMEWRFIIFNNSFEIYAGIIAVMFTGLGIWLAFKISKPKIEVITVEKKVIVYTDKFVVNQQILDDLGISKRELEVLVLMAEGLSNQQIAERLFISLNTIKTHSSNVFVKLDAQRRTQAIEKARRLNIIR